MYLKTIIISLLMAISLASFHTQAADNKWFTSTVKTLYPYADGSFVIVFDNINEGCTGKDKYHRVKAGQNGVSPAAIELMFSTVLSAGTLGKKLSVVYDASTSGCYINRMNIKY